MMMVAPCRAHSRAKAAPSPDAPPVMTIVLPATPAGSNDDPRSNGTILPAQVCGLVVCGSLMVANGRQCPVIPAPVRSVTTKIRDEGGRPMKGNTPLADTLADTLGRDLHADPIACQAALLQVHVQMASVVVVLRAIMPHILLLGDSPRLRISSSQE
ncbi:hypothetical protein VTK73DRAFT_1382 [Phialemonium thermophilum]|uniref:Uncharacterized protein n=1 Tax=Phialemonium thermophilum TaxID=223376 RepID=A0ABR3VTI5_9PEZI